METNAVHTHFAYATFTYFASCTLFANARIRIYVILVSQPPSHSFRPFSTRNRVVNENRLGMSVCVSRDAGSFYGGMRVARFL